MENDDDMIMIIVGDEENQPFAMPIKQESQDPEELDESVLDLESVLETAEMHGEYLDISHIKEENYDCEYLEVDLDNTKQKWKSGVPKHKLKVKIKQDNEEYESSGDRDNGDHSNTTPKLSYIAQLRKNFPKMRKDEECIVAHLAEMMKHTKPPPPPNGFYKEDDGMFVCAFCKAESLTLSIASRHFQKKHGTRYLACYACGRDYRCTTGLYKHEKRCPTPDARIVLKARGRYLGRKGRRRPYLTLNTFDPWDRQNKKLEKKRHFCSQCTASFSQKDALLSHEYMHLGVRPYQCEQCPVAYTSAIALRRHTQKHSGKEYICDACGRSFTAIPTLIAHMNTHLPQRKYPCDRCERRFAQKSALRHHIDRDHLNIPPPFACAACPKRFPRMSNLKAHMQAKHGLTLMTREMFLKALPTMKESDLKQATIVFNSFEDKVITAPLGESIFNGDPRSEEDDISITQDSDKHIHTEPEDQSHMIKTFDVVTEIEAIENDNDVVKNEENVSENEEDLGIPNSTVTLKPEAENHEVKFSKTREITRVIDLPAFETVTETITLDDSEIEIKSSVDAENISTAQSSMSKTVDERQLEIKEVLKKGLAKTRNYLIRRAPIHTRSSVMKTRSGVIVGKIENLKQKLIKDCL